eukprot:m.374826 g.374826  ORF g.374826 m.374826 type:complete len:50 (-) comp56168_c0_seq22:2195-2344(-)
MLSSRLPIKLLFVRRNIEDILAAKGESVQKVFQDGNLELTIKTGSPADS